VRIASDANDRFGPRSGLVCGSGGNGLGSAGAVYVAGSTSELAGAVVAVLVSDDWSDADSLTPRWAKAIANTPNTRTVANADITKTMRFMGTHPVEPWPPNQQAARIRSL